MWSVVKKGMNKCNKVHLQKKQAPFGRSAGGCTIANSASFLESCKEISKSFRETGELV